MLRPHLVLLPLCPVILVFFLFREQTKFVFTSWPWHLLSPYLVCYSGSLYGFSSLGFHLHDTFSEMPPIIIQANCTNAHPPHSSVMWSHYSIVSFLPLIIWISYSFRLVYGWNWHPVRAQRPPYKGVTKQSVTNLDWIANTLDDSQEVL